MVIKKDLYLVALVGFLVGWLIILPAASFGLTITPIVVTVSVVGFTLFAVAALLLLAWLNRFWQHFFEIGKFAAVGTLNSFIDLTVLDALMLATGATSGLGFAIIKWGAFAVGAVNSYFWNKFWTFESQRPVSWSEGARFTVFTLFGAMLNAAVAYAVVTYIPAPHSLSPNAWGNIAAVIAIFANMIWNFLTYKWFVFPKNKSLPTDNQSLITDN